MFDPQAEKLVPVVVIHRAETAVPLAENLLQAGFGAIEVTLRTAAALEAMTRIGKQLPEITLGAGSIRQPRQIGQAVAAGAEFLVSPGCSDQLIQTARETGVQLIPGAATPSEMMRLYEQGFELQKFFPAELSGGAAMLKAVAGPLPEIRFFPTGGIHAGNVADYLGLGNVDCVGGSWFVPAGLIEQQDYKQIGVLARQARALLGRESGSD